MPTVFVSYCHDDSKWFDATRPYHLIPWLERVLRPDQVELWYDRSGTAGLIPGDKFKAEILEVIDRSSLALLLVSEAFLSSEFIRDVELPAIKQRADSAEMAVIPILLEECDWQRCSFIAERQFLPSTKPLIDCTESEREWSHARSQILQGIRRRLAQAATPAAMTTDAALAPAEPALPAVPASLPPWTRYAAAALAILVIAVAGLWLARRDRGDERSLSTATPARAVVQAASASATPALPTAPPQAIPATATRAATAAATRTSPAQASPTAGATRQPPSPTAQPPTPSPAAILPAIAISPANAAGLSPVAFRSQDTIRTLAWLPGGTEVVLSSNGLRAYDPDTRRERKISDQYSDVVAVGKTSAGVALVAAAGQNGVQIWNAESGGEVATFSDLKNARALALSSDATLLAAGIDEAIKLVAVPGGKEVNTLLGVDASVTRVTFSPDGKMLAAGGTNVVLWSVAGGSVLANYNAGNWVRGLAFSPDGATLAVGTYRGLALYDVKQIESLRPRLLRTISDDKEVVVAWSPDGALLAWTASPALVKVWDVAGGRQVATLKGHTSDVAALGFSADGRLLATAANDGMRLWGAGTVAQASPSPPAGTGLMPTPVSLSPAAISVANAGRVVQLNLMRNIAVSSGDVVWSPDGAWLAGGSAQIYDVATGQTRSLGAGRPIGLPAAAPAPSGLASGGTPMLVVASSESIKLWDVKNGAELATYAGLRNTSCLAISKDGTLLAAGIDKAVKLVGVPGGKDVNTLLGVDASVAKVAFSPDGKMLAGAGTDAVLWNIADGSVLADFAAGNWVTGLAFSPDGATLAVGTHSGLKLYDVKNSESLRLRVQRTISEGKQVTVAWSPDGAVLAWSASSGEVKLWDVAGGREVASLSGHTSSVRALAFAPDGALLVSSGGDGTVRLWGVGK